MMQILGILQCGYCCPFEAGSSTCNEVTPQSSAAALGVPADNLSSSKGGFLEGFSLQNGKVLVLLEEIFDFQKSI